MEFLEQNTITFRQKKNLSGEWEVLAYREGRRSPVYVGDLFESLRWRWITPMKNFVLESNELRAIADKLDELNGPLRTPSTKEPHGCATNNT